MSIRRTCLTLAFLLASPWAWAAPQGTAFSYQGTLKLSGAPANDDFDFEFGLFDAQAGGGDLALVTRPDVQVANGLFTVELDYTEVPFVAAQEYFLEVRVRDGASNGAYTTLLPRQKVTPAPYAVFALNGNPGPPGADGMDGMDGTNGAQGGIGPQGPQGPAGFVTLPYSGTFASAGAVFTITNSGNNNGVVGQANSLTSNGVYGYNAGEGQGVLGYSTSGIGVYGFSAGGGNGVTAITQTGNGIFAQTNSLNAGVFGFNKGQGSGVFGENNTGGPGVYGSSHGTGTGVFAVSDFNDGVQGTAYATGKSGVTGIHGGGLVGNGVYGTAPAPGFGVYVQGNFGAAGSKNFVEPHPTDASREIRYASLEGREVGTYFRGSGRIVGGEAVIEVPEDFRIVTSAAGLTVVATPIGALAMVACISKSLDRIVIRGSADVAFDYLVSGVRKAFADFEPVQANSSFVPTSEQDGESMRAALPAESVARLTSNGTLNADGSVNAQTAHRLGWDAQAAWHRPSSKRGDRIPAPIRAREEAAPVPPGG